MRERALRFPSGDILSGIGMKAPPGNVANGNECNKRVPKNSALPWVRIAPGFSSAIEFSPACRFTERADALGLLTRVTRTLLQFEIADLERYAIVTEVGGNAQIWVYDNVCVKIV